MATYTNGWSHSWLLGSFRQAGEEVSPWFGEHLIVAANNKCADRLLGTALHSRTILPSCFLLGTHSLAVARFCHVKYFNVTRFSIEWSKVEPQQGRFDQVQT